MNPHTQCYKCQGYIHFASQCLSQTKTLLVEVPIEDVEEEDDVEVIVHQHNDTRMPLSKSANSMTALELWE